MRPFAKAGFTYFINSDSAPTTKFVAAPAGTGSFSTTRAFDNLLFHLTAGVEILRSNEASLSSGYEGMISESFREHGACAKGTIRF